MQINNNSKILKSFSTKIKSIFGGDTRTSKAKINIFLSFIFKGFSVLAVFLLVPMTIKYLNVLEYGIWVTISSLITWLTLFDLGLGNGLRNKLAESFVSNDIGKGKVYVSTTYFALTIIVILFLIVYFAVGLFFDWSSVFNAPSDLKYKVNLLTNFVILFFGVQFVLKLIITILTADQKPSYNDFFSFITNTLSVLVVWLLTRFSDSSLLNLGLSLSIIPVVVLSILSIIHFSGKYKIYLPSRKSIDLKCLKDLTGLGIKFFIIQISTFFIFGSASIVLTQFIGPESVTPYNIVFRYFSIINMVYLIILSPVWTGFTDAYFRKDIEWIRNTIRKLNKVVVILTFCSVLMVILSGFVYNLWLGENRNFEIPYLLTASMGIYVIIVTIVSPYVYFLNGVGKINLQLILSIFTILTCVPLSILLIKVLNLGIASVVIGPTISLLPFVYFMPIQYNKIMNNNAKGIWDK